MATVWTNIPLPEDLMGRLRDAVAPGALLVSAQSRNILQSAGADPLLEGAEIAYGQPDPRQLLGLRNLKWVHLSTAGYNRYDTADVREHLRRNRIITTNSSTVFAEPCAEHVLAFMLCAARDLSSAINNQLSDRTWPQADIRGRSRLMKGQSALILGFGAIARRLVELLRPLGMQVRAVRRRPAGNEPIPVYPLAEADALLSEADHVINILPGGAETERFMDGRRFHLMKQGAIFYNIGRGTTVEQDALISALDSGYLRAAYLDVTDPEPLPPGHALWRVSNCVITPHTAGGQKGEFGENLEHFLGNLGRYRDGKPLLDVVF